jgi:hypothetical protein
MIGTEVDDNGEGFREPRGLDEAPLLSISVESLGRACGGMYLSTVV